MQVIKLLAAFKQLLIVESGISSSVTLMRLNTDFPWVSCNGSQNGIYFTCVLDPPWERNCTKGLSAELGDLMWCTVSPFWSVWPSFLPVDVEKMGRRGPVRSRPFMV